IASGTAIAAVGMWLLGQLQPHSAYLTGVLIPMTVLAIGLGMVFVPATLSAVSGVDEEHSGLVSGVSTTAIQIGGAIGVAILATVAATTPRHATPGTPLREALTNGYTHAFHIGALVIALAVPIAGVFLRLRPSTGQVSPEPARPTASQRNAAPSQLDPANRDRFHQPLVMSAHQTRDEPTRMPAEKTAATRLATADADLAFVVVRASRRRLRGPRSARNSR